MAASSQRTDRPCKMLAFALLLSATLFNGIKAQEEPVTVKTVLSVPRGDNGHGQVVVLPTVPAALTTTATVTEQATENDGGSPAAPTDEGTKLPDEAQTDIPAANAETPAPIPPRGDGHINIPKPAAGDDVVCVTKDAVAGRNAVNLKLKASSTCKETQMKIASVLQELCGENCKLELYQEDNTKEILVSGKYVEADVTGMTNKFNNDNIKDKTDVEEAVIRWGKNSKLVLVSMLLAGLLLAALLIAGYYLKTHRKNAKGVRLAESFQVDEENQANTLVSVAPLPQEPLDKPIVNGESPPENGTNSTPTTNGHSATQTPVADTEM